MQPGKTSLWDINGNLRMTIKHRNVSILLYERKLYRMKVPPAMKEKPVPDENNYRFFGKNLSTEFGGNKKWKMDQFLEEGNLNWFNIKL